MKHLSCMNASYVDANWVCAVTVDFTCLDFARCLACFPLSRMSPTDCTIDTMTSNGIILSLCCLPLPVPAAVIREKVISLTDVEVTESTQDMDMS